MPPLYLIEQGAKVRIEGGRLLVERDGESLLHVPLGHVSEIVIFGNIGLTTPAIGRLLAENIDVAFLQEDGQYRGRLSAGITPHVPLRRAQYHALEQPGFAFKMAGGFVRAKLEHQRTLLRRRLADCRSPDLPHCIDQITAAIDQIPAKQNRNSLLGLEGSATQAYFRGLRLLLDPVWKFDDRNRRPPKDPINALLSLGYTLLSNIAAGAVQTVGLDPYAGFYHETVYNRPALALDLVEEFRPLVDGVVLWCCNSGQVTLSDFSPGPPERPVLLADKGKKTFLKAFEQRMDTKIVHPLRGQQFPMRQCMIEQARQISRCILDNNPDYHSMGFR